MEDEVTKAEVLRLMAPGKGRANVVARWDNVYSMYQEGKTLDEIGKWIGRSASTARQLLKRAFLEKAKQPKFKWPVDAQGRKVCDVPHPMPRDVPVPARGTQWSHVRGRKLANLGYCPVCKKNYVLKN